MTVRRVSSKHECILVGPQREDSRVGEGGRPQGRDRPPLRGRSRHRHCKQLDERGTLEPRKAPGNKTKLDEQARRLLVDDLRQRPWATHSQRADEMGTHTSLAPVYAYSPVREREDYERLCETSQAMIYAVMSRLLLRRLTRA